MKRISISIVLLACLMAYAAAQSASGVIAYWTEYNVIEINWNMTEANVYCATGYANKSLEWRSKYNWTAFCNPDGPSADEACGKCLNVTYASEFKGTATATVRIVDKCTTNYTSLDLDRPVFDQLNIDNNPSGHLLVDYVFVDCGEPDNTIRLYSGQ